MDSFLTFMWVNFLVQMLQRSKIIILSMKIWKNDRKTHTQKYCPDLRFWSSTLYSYLWAKYMRAVFCYVPSSRLFPHWFCTVLLHRLCRASVALGWCFCSVLLLLADLTRALSTIVTHFSNCSLYYVAGNFFVAS